MKRTLMLGMFVGLFILALGFRGQLGFGDAAKVQAATRNCSLASLKGSYGYTAAGTIPSVGDFVAVGIFTSDGAGQVSGADTATATIGVIEQRTFSGSYAVDADCTGSLTLQFVAPTFTGLVTADIVIVKKSDKIIGVQTTPSPPAPVGVVLTPIGE